MEAYRNSKREYVAFQVIVGHKDWVVDIKSSKEGDTFVSGSRDGSVLVYTKKPEKGSFFKKKISIENDGSKDSVTKVEVEFKEKIIFVGYASGRVKIFSFSLSTNTFKTIYSFQENSSPICSMDYNHKDYSLTVITKNCTVYTFADLIHTPSLLDISRKELITPDNRNLNIPYI